MATLLKLCPEDQQKYPGGPEWYRFDEHELDDLDLLQLNAFEVGLNCTLDFLFRVDKPANSIRWTAARVWLARRMAGLETPPLPDFAIKPRKVEIKEEPKPKARKAKVGDDDVPPSSAPSSDAEVSGTASA